jgi:ribonuclease P protein component
VIQRGKHARTTLLDVRAVASPLSHPRIGVVVPKYRHTVVERNRVKRRIRELARIHVLPVAGSIDLVIHARNDAYRASFLELQMDLASVVGRLIQAVEELR